MIKLKDGSHQILKIDRINIWGNKGLQMMSAMNKTILRHVNEKDYKQCIS